MFEKQHRLIDARELPPQHPVRVFYDYFLSKRGPDGYLDRSSFDPADNLKLLPWVQILEEIEPDVFRHRVVGTAIVALLARDNTGKLFGDGITAGSKQARTEEFRTALATGDPVLSTSALMQEDRSFIKVFRGVFPGRAGETRLIYLPVAATDERLSS
ncbi:PAS domain-containing protein [Pelagibius marinus]|uniref:PAS domain-containing protein n=1 Tax=Pelagibius marinus TaxID=2762760 RepID=UPI0018723DE9|nr:PAS domain-containing protein [Pelagibius marinus]